MTSHSFVTSANGHSFVLTGSQRKDERADYEADAQIVFDLIYGKLPSSTFRRILYLVDRFVKNEKVETNLPGDPHYLKLLEDMAKIHRAKNAGYAGIDTPDRWANFRLSEEIGVPAWKGALIRLQDKYIRIKNLIKNPLNEQVGESVRDTLIDLAAYALIIVCLMDEAREKDKIKNEQAPG